MASSRTSTLALSDLADPGFTPSVKRLPEILAHLAGDEDEARLAERAVLRIEAQYASRVAAGVAAEARKATRPARARLTALGGRLAAEGRDAGGALLAWLLEALGDADAKTRRTAARALGNLAPSAAITRALAGAFDRIAAEGEGRARDEDLRALSLALAKVAPAEASSREVGAHHARAALIAERELARRERGAIDPGRAHTAKLPIRFHTRKGLEDVLAGELGTRFGAPRSAGPGAVDVDLEGALAGALAIRTATHVGFPLARRPRGEDVARDVAAALATEEARAIFAAFTEGRPRFRLVFAGGGHRRAVAWRTAELGESFALNDPRDSTWEVVVDEAEDGLSIELVPRGYPDLRFAYRTDVVAASSHPVLAAALARVAPKDPSDVVWDPFCGAGAELVERARIAPYARLVGTDVDEAAIEAARRNIARAEVERVSIERRDARSGPPDAGGRTVTSIITNPPMGRRVERGGHQELLVRFVERAAVALAPGGALVWIVPERRVVASAERAGLEVERSCAVDMGGFTAELCVMVRARPRARTRRS